MGVGRLVSNRKWLFSGSMLIYQRVYYINQFRGIFQVILIPRLCRDVICSLRNLSSVEASAPMTTAGFHRFFNSFSQIPMTKKCCILLSCCSMGVKTVVNRVTVIMVPEESDRLQSGCFWCLAICFPCDMIHWSMNGGFSWIFIINIMKYS